MRLCAFLSNISLDAPYIPLVPNPVSAHDISESCPTYH